MPDAETTARLTIEAWALVVSGVAVVFAFIALCVSWYQARQAKRSAVAAERSAAASELAAEQSKKWADVEATKKRAEQAELCIEALHDFKNATLQIIHQYHRFKKDNGVKAGNIKIDEWLDAFKSEREAWFRWGDTARIWFDDQTLFAVQRVTTRAMSVLYAMREPTIEAVVAGWQEYGDIPHLRDFSDAVRDARHALQDYLLR